MVSSFLCLLDAKNGHYKVNQVEIGEYTSKVPQYLERVVIFHH